MVKWSRHAAINSTNESITQCSQTIHPEHICVVHNVRNRHKMFYSFVVTGWLRTYVLNQEHFTIQWLAIARIGQRMQPSVVDFLQKPSTTVIWGFLEKFRQQLSEDSCKLRNHPRAIKRQILKLTFTCFIFHYLTDSLKLGNQSKRTIYFGRLMKLVNLVYWKFNCNVCLINAFICLSRELPSVAIIMLLWFGEDFGILALPWTGVFPIPVPVLSG